ncbi:MAG TPA: hypothetical protein VFA50_11980 [Stellaceae bacterium]|nr:hypothetical protein [Stellaceae bacterium]
MSRQIFAKLRAAPRKAAIALGALAVMGGIAAAPAFADEHGWNRGVDRHYHHQDWRGHDWRRYDWREAREYRPYVYAPPVYRYAPPPVYYGTPGLSFDFTVPLR